MSSETFEILPSDRPEKFSDQSASRISNASGTRSVRVNAQGLSRSCCKLSPVKSPSPQLAAPGSRGWVIGYIYQLPVLQIWKEMEVTPFFANFLSFPD